MHYRSIVRVDNIKRKDLHVTAPLYDPVKDAKTKSKKTQQKSAYDVAQSNHKDLLSRFKEEAKSVYPHDKSKQQGHVNKCYTKLVKDNKVYWEERTKQVNNISDDDSDEEEDERDEWKR